MSRKNRGLKPLGGSLADAISSAWDAWEDPTNQDRLEKLNSGKAAKDEENRIADRMRKFRRWGIPKIAAKIIAEGSVYSTPSVDAVRERSDHKLLILAGNEGCGKTVAACTRLESCETGCFVRAAELAEFGRGYADRQRLAEFRLCGVLVVDDLGVEEFDDRMICRLDELLDSRSAGGLPTIITTNLVGSEFRSRYDRRIWSRVHQFGDYVELDDPDLRVTPIGAGRKP